MFSYMSLGKNGQLGNQMFQYAALYALGFLRGEKIQIPASGHDLIDAFPNLSAIKSDTPLTKNIYQEPAFLFDANMWLLPPEYDLFGYFQSSNYFAHCADQIIEEFKFREDIEEKAKKIRSDLGTGHVCTVHFRRKDYLKLQDYHHNQDSQYYNSAVNLVQKSYPETKFIALSDDVQWCKDNLPPELIVIDTSAAGKDSMLIDMCLMSKCQMHIIANSSFSWWGAFLSKSNGVIAPSKWFGERGPKDWESIYVPGWTKL